MLTGVRLHPFGWVRARLTALVPAHRPAVARLPLAHLVAFAVVSWLVFDLNRPLLLSSYDGSVLRAVARLQFEWGTAAPGAAAGPFAGLGNTFFPMNPRYSPSFLVAWLLTGPDVDPRVVYWVIGLELFVAAGFAARALGLPRELPLFAAWLAPVFVLPMCFPGYLLLAGVNLLAPQTAEFAAGGLVLAAIIPGPGRGGRWVALARIAAGYLLVTILAVAGPAAVVLWAVPALMLIGFQVLASETRREALRKLGVVVGVGLALAPGTLPFVAGTLMYSVPAFFSGELENDRATLYMVSSLFHSTGKHKILAGRPFVVAAAVGGLLAGLCGRSRPTRAFGWFMLTALAAQIGLGLAITFLTASYRGPSPLYFEYMLWPHMVLASVYAGHRIFWFVVGLVPPLSRRTQGGTAADGEPLLSPRARWVVSAGWVGGLAAALLTIGTEHYPKEQFYPYTYPPTETPVVAALKREIALTPGEVFRGSVATFRGSKREGGTAWGDMLDGDVEQAITFGNDLRTTGLWYHKIPTLAEYSPLITPPSYLALTRKLAAPTDRQLRSVLVLTRPDAAYLQSLGVRFVISDRPLSAPYVRRAAEPAPGGEAVLFELPDPNLGNYSPTELVVSADARAAVERLTADGFDFRRTAVVAEPIPHPLVAASSGRMRFDREKVRIEASSPGTSVLLLPVQFSRCWRLTVRSSGGGVVPHLVRMNVAQAGLVFSGTVDVELTFDHGPVTGPWGHVRDYLDFRAAHPE